MEWNVCTHEDITHAIIKLQQTLNKVEEVQYVGYEGTVCFTTGPIWLFPLFSCLNLVNEFNG